MLETPTLPLSVGHNWHRIFCFTSVWIVLVVSSALVPFSRLFRWISFMCAQKVFANDAVNNARHFFSYSSRSVLDEKHFAGACIFVLAYWWNLIICLKMANLNLELQYIFSRFLMYIFSEPVTWWKWFTHNNKTSVSRSSRGVRTAYLFLKALCSVLYRDFVILLDIVIVESFRFSDEGYNENEIFSIVSIIY